MKNSIKILVILLTGALVKSCSNETHETSNVEKEDKKQQNVVVENEISEDDEVRQTLLEDYPEYVELMDNSEFFGQWTITNELTHVTYFYEIYKTGDEYTGVARMVEYQYETLIREGDIFRVKDNEYGEYYKINDRMYMMLYDKDGSLRSSGYKATYNEEKK